MREFAELHDELRAVARAQLAAGADWDDHAAAGWLGLEVPEDLGGAGATFAETAVIVEELGRAAATSPFLGSVVLGVGTLLACEPSATRDQLLADVAAGDLILSVGLPTDDDSVGADDEAIGNGGGPTFRVAGGRVEGRATFVPDAGAAAVLLLLAADEDGSPVVVVHRRGAASGGLAVTPTPVLDGTRDLAGVAAADLAVGDGDVLRLTRDPAAIARRGALAVAVDSIGIAAAMLDATVAYAKERRQFDRAIGSFQAVKHQLADALVQLTLSRELVAAAVADPTDARAVSMAKAHATQMAVGVAGTALQLHGGIGYTWEGPVHVHLKRAALNRSLFGSPRAHRAQLAQRYSTEGERHG